MPALQSTRAKDEQAPEHRFRFPSHVMSRTTITASNDHDRGTSTIVPIASVAINEGDREQWRRGGVTYEQPACLLVRSGNSACRDLVLDPGRGAPKAFLDCVPHPNPNPNFSPHPYPNRNPRCTRIPRLRGQPKLLTLTPTQGAPESIPRLRAARVFRSAPEGRR